ncbi:MAG: radical SAM family heme chaperone HemW [Candidatus Ancillula sp.]|jgi:oxygen-independent coproporphyrinogen-3 oxidase|nr:radical SAM family heme chaperone HemW [Candidatus Ancillula sp.]
MAGIYIHIPFCLSKCGYCDFFSKCQTNYSPDEYATSRIIPEFKNWENFISTHQINSVFFGGGTPSLLSPKTIKQIIKLTSADPETAEITIECNPDTLSFEYLRDIKNAGINRISIGVQSFDQNILNILQRRHNPDQVFKAADWCKKLDLNWSLDLIYGSPQESIESWKNTVQKAIELNPDHISAYALTLEPNVPLARKIEKGIYPEIDEDFEAEKYIIADQLLTKSGYIWYEISNWSKPGKESIHNLNYWENGEWIGIGPSAHSHIFKQESNNQTKQELRIWNTREMEYSSESEIITNKNHQLEEIMLMCRLNRPIQVSKFTPKIIAQVKKEGLLNSNNTPTIKGRLLNDLLIQELDSNRACPRFNTTQCLACPSCIMD